MLAPFMSIAVFAVAEALVANQLSAEEGFLVGFDVAAACVG